MHAIFICIIKNGLSNRAIGLQWHQLLVIEVECNEAFSEYDAQER